jgi:hypothetical protein
MGLKEFDQLNPRGRARIAVRSATTRELEKLRRISKSQIPETSASLAALKDTQRYNPSSIFVFEHDGRTVGLYAMLMLSCSGLESLLVGDLETGHPDFESLAHPEEKPAAIYKWAVVAPGMAADGIRQISHILLQTKYRNANLYARPTTEEAQKLMRNLGFKPVSAGTTNLHRYVRIANQH